MQLLVTGATGRIGSRLVPRLLNRGDSVRILVRNPHAEAAEALRRLGAEPAAGDLLRPETLAGAVEGADAIIHLAAFFRGATAEETAAVNTEGTIRLAEAALRAGVSRFVFSSTNLVYGQGGDRPAVESDRAESESPYPASKIAAERALLELHRTEGLDLRIVRFAFAYGEGDPHLREGMRWFADWHPDKKIQLLHHADAAQAIMLAADKPGAGGEIYNAADDSPVRAAEVIALLGETLAADAWDRPLPNPMEGMVDSGKIRRELGFAPLYPSLAAAAAAGAL